MHNKVIFLPYSSLYILTSIGGDIIKPLKTIILSLKNFFHGLNLNCRFLALLLTLAFPIICLSIFDHELDANGSLVAVRTAFSTIIGYLLQKSTSTITTDSKLLKNKTIIVGVLAIVSLIIVSFSYIFDTNINNPSLALIKNLLFSSIGFLTSATSD